MKTPKIQTDKGKQPVTVVPDEHLVEAFLDCCNVSEDEELVRLLCYAEPSYKKAATILRQCLTEGLRLVPVYPGLGNTPPEKSTYIGEIPDGGLYLV